MGERERDWAERFLNMDDAGGTLTNAIGDGGGAVGGIPVGVASDRMMFHE